MANRKVDHPYKKITYNGAPLLEHNPPVELPGSMITNHLTIERVSQANSEWAQRLSWLHHAVVYGSWAICPVYANLKVIDPTSQKRALHTFDLQQYMEDEYAYLEYPLYAHSYYHPIKGLMIFHSAIQELKYDFGTLNPVNKLVSEIISNDYSMKWRGNLVVIPVMSGKVGHLTETEEELQQVDHVVQQYVYWFMGERSGEVR
ncbi:uncharacterized protein ARMOST_08231 [Armillaria ostoyae]|uniref:Uncharacterized protein n=1 Tax=Armillaria ostoyae TaxID=47428 RepID=A0A284R831_ARMOS|nr:uncharacterized protein ARMOST_08231 [Armillaria ostoyae]